MELSERFIKQLEQEFATVYEEQDASGKAYEARSFPYAMAVYVTDGDMTITIGGAEHYIEQNKRFDIPENTLHTVTIGAKGAIYIIGEGKA